jgi:aspartyl protease family protein
MIVCNSLGRLVLRHVSCLLGLAVVLALGGRLYAAEGDPERALRAKGLLKRGVFFCVPEEFELNKAIAGPRAEASRRKRTVDETQAAAAAAKTKLDEFEKQVQKWRQTYDALNVQYAALPSGSPQANRLAQQINPLVALINAAPNQFEQAEKSLKELRTTAAQHREEFIQYVLKLGQDLARLEEQYRKLAADPEVKQALDEYSQAGKKAALGPMKSTLDGVHRLEGSVITDAIPIHPGPDRLYRLFVTINERKPQEMSIDTGASLIVVPYKMAQALNLYVSGGPKIRLQLADGQTVIEADLVTAPTVRVGRFVAKNVRCAVLPANLDKAEALLGMSFLGQYNFKIDKEQSKLILATVGGAAGSRGSKSTAGAETATPAEAPATPAASAEGAKPKTRTEQLAELLTLPADEAAGQRELRAQGQGGKPLVFRPAKRGPAKSLQERFGEPDEMRKVPAPRASADDSATQVFWKIWVWGPVLVLVDESGTTRFFAVTEP